MIPMATAPPVLSRRFTANTDLPGLNPSAAHTLSLSAEERTRLRGRRTTDQGLVVVLQLQRSGPLQPGERLSCDRGSVLVRVEAAKENLFVVEASTPLALLQAAYHLGNRHLPIEIRTQRLLIPADAVLAQLLRDRGLSVRALHGVFHPESGAYAHAHVHAAGVHAHGGGHGLS